MQLSLMSEFDNRSDKSYNTPLRARAGFDYGASGLLSLAHSSMTREDGTVRNPYSLVVDVKYPVRTFRYVIPYGRNFRQILAVVKKLLDDPIKLVRYLDTLPVDRAELA